MRPTRRNPGHRISKPARQKESEQYLQLEGPNARAYLQGYVRYAGGATWHWAGLSWRISPEDMRLKSLYGVGRDWPFSHDVLEPFLYGSRICHRRVRSIRSHTAMAAECKRSKPYPMGPTPFGPGEQRLTEVAAKIGLINLPAPQARNSGVSYHGRPACCGNNNCFPVCPIAAKYDAATALPKIEAKGGKILTNAVVYRIETAEKKRDRSGSLFRSGEKLAPSHRQDLRDCPATGSRRRSCCC